MSFRDDAIEALRAGQNAGVDDVNPYTETSRILAKVWERGWRSMAAIRTGTGPGRAPFLSGDADTG
ncbi:hypothetical protein Jolie2_5 [Mycobacterium phage Jolie2]|uniref:Uncharacterized protein n=1 Tax=Mycobacterium phage Jolie2 TaxID=1458831 RepID=W8EHX0_9CAUD|nr:hypothetical protein Jolie2_5 [Mycobacterium phage Jolie2]AHJ86555.1 hypothetical protein Jolie2_5 [Mycobacterium phage Jolie2]